MYLKTLISCFLWFHIKTVLTETCTTRDNKTGECLLLSLCPEAIDNFANVKRESEDYLRQFICGNHSEVKVCCKASSKFNDARVPNSLMKNIGQDAQNLFQCDRKNDSFLQVVEYRQRYFSDMSSRDIGPVRCLGTLINTRYVLTAAECLTNYDGFGAIIRIKVKLGKTTSFKDYLVEEVIKHPFYDEVNNLNNIGLIIIFRSNIEGENPVSVCLGWHYAASMINPEDKVTVTGKVTKLDGYNWEMTSTKILSNSNCKDNLNVNKIRETLTYKFCTSDMENNRTVICSGVAGTPAFYSHANPLVLGISSSNTICGDERPNVYTNVNFYFDWILENMKMWPFITKINSTDRCTTPENTEGRCIPLLSCPEILEAFANVKHGSEKRLRQFICDTDKEVKVCCDLSSSPVTDGDDNYILERIESTVQGVNSERMREGRNEKEEFTLAELQAITSLSNYQFTKCLGALISPRYVLTAAECLVKDNTMNVAVRFTVNIDNKTVFMFFGIEEEITHPFYNIVTDMNNIGLIRISRNVDEKDNILRVNLGSLPTVKNGDRVISAGTDGDRFDWKTVSTKFLSNHNCKRILQDNNVEDTLIYKVCTTDLKSDANISCTDYAGTPVVFPEGESSWLLGISSSRTLCGKCVPNIYTNVSIYMDWILENMKPWPLNNTQCTTLKGEAGGYVPLKDCPYIMELFANPEKGSEEHLRKHMYDKENPFVCCNLQSSFNSNVNQNISIPKEFVEAKAYCGYQQKDQRFTSQHNITIDEFPWMAYVATRIPGEFEPENPLCSGSLISRRYVLTDAECLDNRWLTNIVRLGEFSTRNSTDCVILADISAEDCNTFTDYGVEEKIKHPFYLRYPHHINDIGLLRLNRSVDFTDFIRPICLPLSYTRPAKPGDVLYTSGFGYDPDGRFQEFKKKIASQLSSSSQCKRDLERGVHPYLMCSKGLKNNTEASCGYDDGGPLMIFGRKHQWHIEGVIIINSQCYGRVFTFTKVSKYLKWIFDNIRP